MLRRGIDVAVLITLLGSFWWALTPFGESERQPSEGVAMSGPEAGPTKRATLDVSAFDRVLWFVAPPPATVLPPPKPPEMPRLELVGIIRQGGTLRAMIVDADDQELRILSAGDAIGVTRILEITDNSVRCQAHGRSFELLLDVAGGSGA